MSRYVPQAPERRRAAQRRAGGEEGGLTREWASLIAGAGRWRRARPQPERSLRGEARGRLCARQQAVRLAPASAPVAPRGRAFVAPRRSRRPQFCVAGARGRDGLPPGEREGRRPETRRQFLRLAWLAASLRARRLREAFTPQPLSRCQTVLFTKAEWPEVPNPRTERRRASPFRRARASRRLGSCSWRRLPRAASRNAYVPQLGPGCLWT